MYRTIQEPHVTNKLKPHFKKIRFVKLAFSDVKKYKK